MPTPTKTQDTTNLGGAWFPPVAVETGSGSPVSVTVPDHLSSEPSRYLRLRVSRP